MNTHTITLAACLGLFPLTGCAATHPAGIQHVVLIKLNDPSLTPQLIDDCDRLLPAIDGVVEYWSGTPDRSGRESPFIDTDWDVALCVGYPDDDAYEAYVVDPKHVELVDRWKTEFTWLRIHDVDVGIHQH